MQEVLSDVGLNFRETKEMSVRLQQIRNRAKRCVCRYCGRHLGLRKITYAAYDEAKVEIYCEHCQRIEHGVEPEIYRLAEYFVDDMRFDHYWNLDESEQKRRMNIAVVCDIVYWSMRNAGLLDEEGFKAELHMDPNILGEAFLISHSTLHEDK